MRSVSRADPQDHVTSAESAPQKSAYFYQNNLLTTGLGKAGTRHIFRADGKVLAQAEKPGVIKILHTDDTNTVLGVSPKLIAYSPYGYIAREKTVALLAFHGQLLDPITHAYFLGNGHRMHHTSISRFGKADTLSPFDKGGINAYAYCFGDPINREDPTGRWGKWFRRLFNRGPKHTKISKLVANPTATFAEMEDSPPTYQYALAKWGLPEVRPPAYTKVPYEGQTTININLGKPLTPIDVFTARSALNRIKNMREYFQTHEPKGPNPELQRYNDLMKLEDEELMVLHRINLALRQ